MADTEGMPVRVLSDKLRARAAKGAAGGRAAEGRQDWSSWPAYDAATDGAPRLLVSGAVVVRGRPGTGRRPGVRRPTSSSCATSTAPSTRCSDRCPHRGVPLSLGTEEFPGTLSCAYHGWTYRLSDGELVAVITDGPDSPICGKVRVARYPAADALGLVWVFVGDRQPHPLAAQLPEELVDAPPHWHRRAHRGSRRRLAPVRRERLRRGPRQVPPPPLAVADVQGDADVEQDPHRASRSVDLSASRTSGTGMPTSPASGTGRTTGGGRSSPRQAQGKMLGNTGGAKRYDPYIAVTRLRRVRVALPCPACCASPTRSSSTTSSTCRSRPIARGTWGSWSSSGKGSPGAAFFAKYLGGIRWLFHGQLLRNRTTGWSSSTDAPPERLYRPDISLIEWRRLVEEGNPFDALAGAEVGGP